MDSEKKSIGVRSQKSEAGTREQVTGKREQPDKTRRFLTVPYSLFPVPFVSVLLVLLTLVFSPGARAQGFTSGSTAALGNFANPLTIPIGTQDCSYDLLRVDLAQGKVFAHFTLDNGFNPCPSALQDVTTRVFTATSIPAFGADGVLDVANFTLQPTQIVGNGVTMEFVQNGNNTPVIIRATGNVTINANTTISVAGQPGANANGLLRGQGGAGGPGGYRGGGRGCCWS